MSTTCATVLFDERGSKIARISVLDCDMSPVWRQMVIKISVSNDFLSTFVNSIKVFECHLSGVINLSEVLSILFTDQQYNLSTNISSQNIS